MLEKIRSLMSILQQGRDKTSELAVEETVMQQALLLDLVHDGVIIRDMEGGITLWNEGAARLYGFTREEALGYVSHELLQTVFPAPLAEILDELGAKDLWEGELQHTAHDGSRIFVASRWVLQRDADHRPVAVFELNRDVTRARKAEKERDSLLMQISHAQRLESLGVLAGGIAHDFNNILTSVMGNTELALLQTPPGSPIYDHLCRVDKGSRRAADLVKQMLAYSGKEKFTLEQIDMSKLVEEMVRMLQASISKKTTLLLDLARPLRGIRADGTQMRQALMNLVLNASEALEDEVGKVKISTGQAFYREEELKDFLVNDEGLAPGFYVSLAVSDTGCGMDQAARAKIFDSFFSTKLAGGGLGMAAVLGIVRGHKGGVKLDSAMGRGSTFTILLPAGDDMPAAFAPAQPGSEPLGKGLVLLVDDEEEVCQLVGKMLAMLGYGVVTAKDGHKALEIYLRRDDFAFVILDLNMPVMDGEQTCAQLRGINPAVKVVITSGYCKNQVAKRFEGKGVNAFLQKPFDIATLRKVLG